MALHEVTSDGMECQNTKQLDTKYKLKLKKTEKKKKKKGKDSEQETKRKRERGGDGDGETTKAKKLKQKVKKSLTEDLDNVREKKRTHENKSKNFEKDLDNSKLICQSTMDAAAARSFRDEHGICLEGKGSDLSQYFPISSFKETGLSPSLLECTKSFDRPSPIQSQSWPVLLDRNRDLIGLARTGSGKTLAFVLPGVHRLLQNSTSRKSSSSPRMLILAPTRELAKQSHDVCEQVGQHVGIKSACVYGGGDRREMGRAIMHAHIIVATPGRLIGLVRNRELSLEHIEYLVLDECDRMLDESFSEDVRVIVSYIKVDASQRQTALFSATWPPSVQNIANEFMRTNSTLTIRVGSRDQLEANRNIRQVVEVIEPFERDRRINVLLKQYHNGKNRIIVFVLYKKEAARVERMLQSLSWNCIAIHGDMSQHDRFEALERFKSGTIPILVATDVAARGLDIPTVEVVINYSFPLTIEDYVHRIGRTARGLNNTGIAHTLFTKLDRARAGELVNVLNQAQTEVPESLLNFGCAVKKKEHGMYGAHFKADDRVNVQKSSHIKF